jgi:hypothetical protein
MKARIAPMVILAVLLSACGSSTSGTTQSPASGPLTQATMDAARDANATIIAGSIPTAVPTDTPKPAGTNATNTSGGRTANIATDTPKPAATTAARSGTGATATAAPTRAAGASSTSLTQTLQGPQRCVFVRYPSDWKVDEDQGLAKGDTDDCPGGASVGRTTHDHSCDDNSWEDMISLSGPRLQSDIDNSWPIVILRFVRATCSSSDDLIKDVQRTGSELAADDHFAPPMYSSIRQQTIAGYPAQCFDASSTYRTGTPVRGSICFFSVSGSLFTLGWGAEESYWQQSSSVLSGIIASLELHHL